MDEIQPHDFNGRQIRTVVDAHGALWIFAADICHILGIRNPSAAVRRLPEHERSDIASINLSETSSDQLKRAGSPFLLVTKPGAYRLALRSDKPEAIALHDYIVHELLPAAEERRVAQTPGEFLAVRADLVAMAEASLVDMQKRVGEWEMLVAHMRSTSEAVVQVRAEVDEVKVRVVGAEDRIEVVEGELWARKSEVYRKTCRGWASKAHREGRLLVEPSEGNLRRLGQRVGKLCRARGIEKEHVDDDRHDEVGSWPVEMIEAAAVELGFVTSPA